MYKFKEIWSVTYGRLFTICYLEQTPVYDGIYLKLKQQNWDNELHVYPEGDEFWFALAELPMSMQSVSIDSKNVDGIISATLFISEDQTTLHSRHSLTCPIFLKLYESSMYCK